MIFTASSATRFNLALFLPLIVLPCLIGLCVAEYALGRAKNTFLGWILPIISFISGLIISFHGLTLQEPIGEIVLWFLIPQIPFILFLLILGVARNGQKVLSSASTNTAPDEIKRMNIQDL